jgi:hypothetical protein
MGGVARNPPEEIKMFLYLLAIAIIALNIAATSHVFRDGQRLAYEKAAEIGLIWIVPVMGALVSVCISLQGPSRIREYEDIGKFFRTSS